MKFSLSKSVLSKVVINTDSMIQRRVGKYFKYNNIVMDMDLYKLWKIKKSIREEYYRKYHVSIHNHHLMFENHHYAQKFIDDVLMPREIFRMLNFNNH
jgi:starvation-inducible outer membrane lipoprotein